MNDLSKLLDLNEEDELLLLQIEVEQEERNIRREEKRRRKEEKKTKKITKKSKFLPNTDDQLLIHQCLNDLIENIIHHEENKINSKRTFDYSEDELSKKIKLDEKN
jgi:adenosyl cobinamide kinase/adenosyl cobinamide phosphate guanylyltransferase